MLQSLIENYGYLTVFIGAFLEGETILVMAGFAAYRGYLDLEKVILIALFAGFLGDQLYFFLGRRHGRDILARFPTLKPRVERVDTLLRRYHLLLIPGIRFMYGLRIVGPIAFGMGRVEAVRFLFLNFIGATLWAPLIAGAGYLFGGALESLLHDIHRYEKLILGAFICFGLGAWAVRRLHGE
jgi:membrane protein DedA with SNARE-associated domain